MLEFHISVISFIDNICWILKSVCHVFKSFNVWLSALLWPQQIPVSNSKIFKQRKDDEEALQRLNFDQIELEFRNRVSILNKSDEFINIAIVNLQVLLKLICCIIISGQHIILVFFRSIQIWNKLKDSKLLSWQFDLLWGYILFISEWLRQFGLL